MHWIADPENVCAALGDAINERRKCLANSACTHTRNECDATWFVIWIELCNKCECIFYGGLWSKFDTDWVTYLG